jgi:hypothetical protein
VRWTLLAAVAAVIIVLRTIRNGWFHGKDWLLYVILALSIYFVGRYIKPHP